MTLLEQFTKQHFLSEDRKKRLLDFLKTYHLVEITELVIDQITQKSLPDLSVTTSRFYTTIKNRLNEITINDDYDEIEEVVMEFSMRLMRVYYENSSLTVSQFMQQLKASIVKSAESIDIDPITLDKSFKWKSIESALPPSKDDFTSELVMPDNGAEPNSSCYLLWNQDADFGYLEKVLVEEFEVFHQKDGLKKLFDKTNRMVICNANRIHFLAYLFRQLCPVKEDANILDGRILLVSPKGKLWEALSLKLVRPDNKYWSIKTLRNYCSDVTKLQKYEGIKQEADTIVKRLRWKLGVTEENNLVRDDKRTTRGQ